MDNRATAVTRLTLTSGQIICLAAPLAAAGPDSCTTVRLAEPGWNDLALTTGTAAVVLEW